MTIALGIIVAWLLVALAGIAGARRAWPSLKASGSVPANAGFAFAVAVCLLWPLCLSSMLLNLSCEMLLAPFAGEAESDGEEEKDG